MLTAQNLITLFWHYSLLVELDNKVMSFAPSHYVLSTEVIFLKIRFYFDNLS